MIPTVPADLINQALDAIGSDKLIGSIDDGTIVSEMARRNYGILLRALLRTAHWSFARKRAPLLLLGDATGQTLAANGSPYPTTVEPPWQFAYAWPVDCVKPIWLPLSALPPTTGAPLMTSLTVAAPLAPMPIPARFLVASSDDFPVVIGETDWDSLPDLSADEGVGPVGRRIILTNQQNANLVFTKLALAPEEWDPLFRTAFVAVLGQAFCLKALDDRKVALAERDRQIGIAQRAIADARVASANEAGFPQSTDHTPDWIRARRAWGPGVSGWAGTFGPGMGPGFSFYGWDSMGWSNGSVF